MVNGFPELGSFRAFNGLSSFEGQNSRTKDKSKESVHNYDRKLHSKFKKLGSGYIFEKSQKGQKLYQNVLLEVGSVKS